MAFFSQHGCTTNAANAKYNSRAAQLYREKIKAVATQATRRHGTEVLQTSCLGFLSFVLLHQLSRVFLLTVEMFGKKDCGASPLTFHLRLAAPLPHSCGSTVRVLSLQRHQKTSRWTSSACTRRYGCAVDGATSPVSPRRH